MKVFNRPIKLGGHSRTINDIAVRVLEYDHEGNVLRASGLTVPTGSGYAKGALFIKTDAATGTKGLYENQGTTTSASFNQVGAIGDAEIAFSDGGAIDDNNGNELVVFGVTASAVNELKITNAATGGLVTLAAQGGDTDVSLAINAKGDGAVVLGSAGYGRLATKTAAGSAITIDSSYTRGEAWELRYTSTKADNSQFQGIFLEVRSSVANSSTIRGGEFHAAQDGAVAIGVLEGLNSQAITRSATTGDVTSMYGLTGEVTHNSNAYTGTITNLAAVRGKVSLEDGTTYTNSSVFLAQLEAITGADVIGSILRAENLSGVSATSVLDIPVTATNFLKVASSGQGGLTVSAGGMVKDPLNDAEAGYITIAVGGDSYQVPIYATV